MSAVACSVHDPQFAGIHMAIAMMEMRPQMQVACDTGETFLRAAAAIVKNIVPGRQPHGGRATAS